MFSKTKLQNLLSLSTESDVNSRLKSFLQPCIKVIFTSTWTLRMITVAELSRKFRQCIGTSQVTLNPAVVHYKNGKDVKHKSYVFLLPESRHDANFVYAILKELANYVTTGWIPLRLSIATKPYSMWLQLTKSYSVIHFLGIVWRVGLVKVPAIQ